MEAGVDGIFDILAVAFADAEDKPGEQREIVEDLADEGDIVVFQAFRIVLVAFLNGRGGREDIGGEENFQMELVVE